MPEWRITRLRGGYALTFDRDGRRRRHTLNASSPREAQQLAPALYAELTKPAGRTVKDLWKAYEVEKEGRAVLETMKWTWKALEPTFGHRDGDRRRGPPHPCQFTEAGMSEMVERVARALCAAEGYGWAEDELYMRMARAGIEAMREPPDAFLALVAERMHDARFSQSGETYPVLRNFFRAVVDAATRGQSEAARDELAKQAQELDMGY